MMFSWLDIAKSPRMVPGGGLTAIGGTCHCADHLDSVNATEAHHYHGTRGHRSYHRKVEGTVYEVSIMLAQNLGRELHHLHAGDGQPLGLEAGEDTSYKATLNR